MSKIKNKLIFLSFLLTTTFSNTYGQFEVLITVTGGDVTTTCGDILSAPDPFFSVNIGNTGWVTYPENGACPNFTGFPNVQWQQAFNCLTDVPMNIEICLRVFENDPILAIPPDPCDIEEDCMVEVCGTFPLPPFGGGNFTLEVPDGQDSDGFVEFSITNQSFPGGINDFPCTAIGFGLINPPVTDTVGIGDLSIFSNYCASNIGEPNPATDPTSPTGWNNDVGTWYSFSTDNDPGSAVVVYGFSDPQNLGDPVNLQLAVYTTDNNNCSGNFELVSAHHDPADFDEFVIAPCLEPNTNYWILVDGVSDTPDELEGLFGLEVVDYDTDEAPDFICQALDLGIVPDNDSLEALGYSNFCATAPGDLSVNGFGVQNGVWFNFTPPTSGHISIDAVGVESTNFPLDIQMAVFESQNMVTPCFGPFNQVTPGLDQADLNANIELSCLDPNGTYYIVIDGTANQFNKGIFDLTITDLGDNTPRTDQMITLCFGTCLDVGSSTYCVAGSYADTIPLPSGCDSIVNTDLTILSELELDLTIDQLASDIGINDGAATVSAMGSMPTYTYLWSNGQTTATATALIGGDNYCVTITDMNGCERDTCFDMPFIVNFIPNIQGDLLDCFGDDDGVISVSAFGGEPPYLFSWSNSNMTATGNGQVTLDNEIVLIENLTAGIYSVSINDIFFDTIITVEVIEPDQLSLFASAQTNVSCFGACDGNLTMSPQGGTPPYSFSWSSGQVGPNPTSLCAGIHNVTMMDSNGCTEIFSFEILQPAEFIATASELNAVSCLNGSDGEVQVTTNGTPIDVIWDDPNASNTDIVTGLQAGFYSVTVTNIDGCMDTTMIEVTEPNEAVLVQIDEIQPISCQGADDAILEATVSGPGSSFTYVWTPGGFGPTIENVEPGSYSIEVTNERGCSATATYNVSQPTLIEATYSTSQETCIDGGVNGAILVENVTGGYPPYVYSIDGINYFSNPLIDGLTGGSYNLYIQDEGGCIRTFSVFVEGIPNLAFELGSDLDLLLGDSIVLDASTISDIPNLTYQWEPANLFSCPTCPVNSLTPSNNTNVTVTAFDEITNCSFTDELFINVNKQRRIYIPNVFSPNDDGINDFFTIYGGSDVNIIRNFKVFDRFGSLVFEADNFKPEANSSRWYGRFNGDKLNPAVFVYFAEVEFIDGEIELFRGDVMLVK